MELILKHSLKFSLNHLIIKESIIINKIKIVIMMMMMVMMMMMIMMIIMIIMIMMNK
jgi:hypothetical protein